MPCETNVPVLGCCGGTILPAQITSAVVTAEYFVTGFGTAPGCGWGCFKEQFEEIIFLTDPQYFQRTTTTLNPKAPNLSTRVVEEKLFPGWPGGAATYDSDVPYSPGGFVGSRKLRPAGSPDLPENYVWQITRSYSKPYTYEDARADFMVLLRQAKVTAPTINMCFGAAWDFYYDANGIINGPALPIRVALTGADCYLGPQSPFGQTLDVQGWRVGNAGFTLVAGSQPLDAPVLSNFDDMGSEFSASFLAKKARVRMDKAACLWRLQAAQNYAYDGTAKVCGQLGGDPARYGGAPQCPGMSCRYVPLPTQGPGTEPDPRCPAKFPKYVEFLALPDGLDPVTEEGDPTSGVWYLWAACSECFGS